MRRISDEIIEESVKNGGAKANFSEEMTEEMLEEEKRNCEEWIMELDKIDWN